MKSGTFLIKPAPSFDEPIEMLKVCHERIATQCATLEKLATHLPLHGADEQARQAATNIMRYFDVAGPHHHADEEEDLFPMLIRAGRYQVSSVADRIASLVNEHRSFEGAWTHLRTVLADIADGKTRLLEPVWVADFVGAYRSHIAIEESQIFPFAEACLDRSQLARLSAAMVARRTITSQ